MNTTQYDTLFELLLRTADWGQRTRKMWDHEVLEPRLDPDALLQGGVADCFLIAALDAAHQDVDRAVRPLYESGTRTLVGARVRLFLPPGLPLASPPKDRDEIPEGQVRIAFDGDAVLFDESSEIVYKAKGLVGFQENEDVNQDVPMPEGPYAIFRPSAAYS